MKLPVTFEQRMLQLQQRLDQLSTRDRFALITLTIFLLVFGIGFSAWALHKKADQAQLESTEQRELLLWMRSQALNIKPTQATPLPLNDIIQTTAQNQGLTVAQTPNGNQIQVAVTHQSFAVLGSWLSRMAEQGVSIEQLDISQIPSGELQLKAVLSQGA